MRISKQAALALALSPTLVGCSGWQSAMDVHGQSAIALKHLIVLIVVVCSIVWSLVMIMLSSHCPVNGSRASGPRWSIPVPSVEWRSA